MTNKILWLTMTVLAVGVAGYAITNVAVPAVRAPFVANIFTTSPIAGYGHLGFGFLAMLIGPFQFHAGLRTRFASMHRWLGRVYVTSVLISAVAGFALALNASGGLVAKVGFALMAVIWFISATLAFTHIRNRDVVEHRRWMIRNYALTLAGVTLRVYLGLFFAADVAFSEFYPVLAWASWVPNLLVVEWFMLQQERRPKATP